MASICVLRQYHVPLDPRVNREVTALVDAGHRVDVVCVRRQGEKAVERAGRLTIWRLPLERRRAGVLRYLAEYAAFFVAAAVLLHVLHIRRRFSLVQVNTLPDALVFATAGVRLLGVPVLLDLHECMPEFLATKFGLAADHRAVRAVAAVEQAAIRYASAAITCTEPQRRTFVGRGAEPEAITVILNGTDESVFDPSRYPGPTDDGPFLLISHGAVERLYGLDTAVRAVARLRDHDREVRLQVFGDGSYMGELRALATELGVADRVDFSDGYVPIDELVAAIARSHAGIVAIKQDAFRDLVLANKLYDFVTMRTPALVSRTQSVEEYFDDGCFWMFRSDDDAALAEGVRALAADPELGRRLVEHAADVAEPHRWPAQRAVYLGVVDRLLRRS